MTVPALPRFRPRFFPLVVCASVVVGGASCPGGEPDPDPQPAPFAAVTFPADFAWGTAVAGWQVEGDFSPDGPVDSNWSRWMAMGEGDGGQTNPDGNGFYTRFADDARLAQELGLDTFRLGLDWSRVMPEPGVIDEAELDHFDDVLDALVANGLKPVLTLYHWTVPSWVQNPDANAPGGAVDLIATKDRAIVDDWEVFVRAVIPRVKDRVDTYTVLNEPFSMIVAGYVDGSFPPGRQLAIGAATDFGINLVYMHARAFDVIKELDDADADGDGADSFVGLTMAANLIYPETANPDEQFAADSLNYVYNDWIPTALTSGALDVNLDGDSTDTDTDPVEGIDPALAGRLEFIGVQYYGPVLVKDFPLLSQVAPLYGLPLIDVEDYTDEDAQKRPHNGMGREISAAGFADTLDRYATYGLPLIVTENGTTLNRRPPEESLGLDLEFDGAQGAMYLVTHLWELGRALERGVDVRGYYHWTLADNYEWVEGRRQRFGAYTVDFSDPALPRTKNAIGDALSAVIERGGVDEALWNERVLPKFPTDETEAGLAFTTRENPR